MATRRAKSVGEQLISRREKRPLKEESIDELKAKYGELAMDRRTLVPIVLGPTGTAMSIKSVGDIHHPTNINKDSTATAIPGLHHFFAKTAAGELTRVVLTDHTFTK